MYAEFTDNLVTGNEYDRFPAQRTDRTDEQAAGKL